MDFLLQGAALHPLMPVLFKGQLYSEKIKERGEKVIIKARG